MEPSLGQRAYELYLEKCDGKSLISGAELPVWPDVHPEIQACWEHVGLGLFRYAEAQFKKGLK